MLSRRAFVRQNDQSDCGAAALAMMALHQVVSFGQDLKDIIPLLLILLAYAGGFTLIASR